MSDRIIARRYAEALYQEAARENTVAHVDEDVDMLAESVRASRELKQFFNSPLIAQAQKLAILDRLFDERVNPVTMRFLRLMTEKKREALIPTAIAAYRTARDERQGIVVATARVATDLSDDLAAKMQAKLSELTGQQVRLELERDERLLGGAVIQVGDTVYDGSVVHQLNLLRKRLETARP